MLTDLRISLAYENNVTKGTGDSLLSDPSDDQPGWFLRVYKNEGYDDIVKYTRIDPEDVISLAQKLDGLVGTAVGSPGVARAVTLVNHEHANRRNERRRLAEEQIAKAQRTLEQIEKEEGKEP